MDEFWIPRSANPNDPRKKLSPAAQRRIVRAQLEADRMLLDAVTLIAARQLTGPDERFERNQAAFRAARHLLTVVFAEFQKAGFSTAELIAVMKDEVQAAASSLELYASQERSLYLEFWTASHADPSGEEHGPDAASPEQLHEERKAKVAAYCQKHDGMPREQFAQDVLHVGRTTFYDWLDDPDSVPRLKAHIENIIDKLV